MDLEKNNLNNEELDNIICLNDEEGNSVPFEFLDLVEFEKKEYVVLLPVEEGANEVVILQLEENSENEDEESYIVVEDQDTLNAVFAIFKEKFKEDFNFVD